MQTTQRVSNLEDHTGYWLRLVSNHVSQAFAKRIETRGISVAEWVVLRILFDKEAEAPSNIAHRLGMTRGAITKVADKLIAKKLIARAVDPEDGRAQLLNLSAKGKRLVPELAMLADQNDSEFFGHLSAADRKALTRILKQIAAGQALKSAPVD
jgi:DNA-binding MarR family transcriptional regulator